MIYYTKSQLVDELFSILTGYRLAEIQTTEEWDKTYVATFGYACMAIGKLDDKMLFAVLHPDDVDNRATYDSFGEMMDFQDYKGAQLVPLVQEDDYGNGVKIASPDDRPLVIITYGGSEGNSAATMYVVPAYYEGWMIAPDN